jgi:hypothetical protein
VRPHSSLAIGRRNNPHGSGRQTAAEKPGWCALSPTKEEKIRWKSCDHLRMVSGQVIGDHFFWGIRIQPPDQRAMCSSSGDLYAQNK